MPHWWWGKLVIDLETMSSNREKKPVLLDHRTDQPVGYSEKLELNDDGFVIEGVFVENEFSAQVQSLLEQGFPYEASIGIEVGEFERLSEDEFATVNGRRFDGPGVIARHSTYREVSFVVLGADQDTSAEQLSKKNDTQVEVTVLRSPSSEGDEAMDLEKLKKEHPEIYADLLKQGASEARAEFLKLLSAASDDQVEVVAECVRENLSIADAAIKLAADAKERRSKDAESREQELDAARKEARLASQRQDGKSLGGDDDSTDADIDTLWEEMSVEDRGEFFGSKEQFKKSLREKFARQRLEKRMKEVSRD